MVSVAKVVIGLAAGAVAVVVAVALPVAVGAATAQRPAGASVCVSEEYHWVGQATLAAGESFNTGVSVPEQPGTALEVKAVDYSADPVSGTVAIRIGATAVSGGVVVAGGEIAATNGGTDVLMVTSVALDVDRCHEVDQAPAVPDDPAVPTPVVTHARTDGLPSTGATSASLVLFAAVASVAGMGLMAVSRRRTL